MIGKLDYRFSTPAQDPFVIDNTLFTIDAIASGFEAYDTNTFLRKWRISTSTTFITELSNGNIPGTDYFIALEQGSRHGHSGLILDKNDGSRIRSLHFLEDDVNVTISANIKNGPIIYTQSGYKSRVFARTLDGEYKWVSNYILREEDILQANTNQAISKNELLNNEDAKLLLDDAYVNIPQTKIYDETHVVLGGMLLNHAKDTLYTMQCYTIRDPSYTRFCNVVALDIEDGHEKWRYRTPWIVLWSAMVMGGDGTLYVSPYGHVIALDPTDGSEKWRYSTPAWNYSLQAVDDVIYTILPDGRKIVAINKDGSKKWEAGPYDNTDFTTVRAYNDVVYVHKLERKLYSDPLKIKRSVVAIDPEDGHEKFELLSVVDANDSGYHSSGDFKGILDNRKKDNNLYVRMATGLYVFSTANPSDIQPQTLFLERKQVATTEDYSLKTTNSTVYFIIPNQEVEISGPTTGKWSGRHDDSIISVKVPNGKDGEFDLLIRAKRDTVVCGAFEMNSGVSCGSSEPNKSILKLWIDESDNPNLRNLTNPTAVLFYIDAKGWHNKDYNQKIAVNVTLDKI